MRNLPSLRGTLLVAGAACALIGAAGQANADGMPGKSVVATTNWSGLYAGWHAGYGWGKVEADTFDTAGAFVASSSRDIDGGFAGMQIGYNFGRGDFLFGVEADISGGNISGSSTTCTAQGCASGDGSIDGLATLRGRIGIIRANWMFYGTGGFAWAHGNTIRKIESSVVPALVGLGASDGGWNSGWVAGAGVEWSFAPMWSMKLEYQHLDFDTSSDFRYAGFPLADRRAESDLTIDTVRIGLNYRFGDRREAIPLK